MKKQKKNQMSKLDEVDLSIQMIEKDMYERKNMQFKNEMMEKSIEDLNKLNKINRDKEELKILLHKISSREIMINI